jgi:hypothetical protein
VAGDDPIPVKVWEFTKKDAGGNDAKDSDVEPSDKFFHGTIAVSDAVTVERDGTTDVDGGVFRDEPTPTPTATPTATPTPTASGGGGSLPRTGLAIGGFLVAGGLLIGGGAALTILARRRRTAA